GAGAHRRDMEERYVAGDAGADLERRIVDTSLRFGVLCRFTAWVAVDSRVVTEGGQPHRVVQPVELPAGWELAAARPTDAPTQMRLMAAIGMPMAAPSPVPSPVPSPAPSPMPPAMPSPGPLRATSAGA